MPENAPRAIPIQTGLSQRKLPPTEQPAATGMMGAATLPAPSESDAVAWAEMLGKIGRQNCRLSAIVGRRATGGRSRGGGRMILEELEKERTRIARDLRRRPAAGGYQNSYRIGWRNPGDIKNPMADMTSPILKRLIEMCCRHNFSWPHRAGCTANPTSLIRYVLFVEWSMLLTAPPCAGPEGWLRPWMTTLAATTTGTTVRRLTSPPDRALG